MTEHPLFDDILMIGRDAFRVLMDARGEVKAEAKKRARKLVRKMDLVSRDEFDAAFAMLAKARGMQEELAARLSKIESHLGIQKSVKKKKQNLRILKGKPVRRTRKK